MNKTQTLEITDKVPFLEEIIKMADTFDKVLNETDNIIKEVQEKINLISASMLMGLPNFYINTATEEALAKFTDAGGKYKILEYSDKAAAAEFSLGENILSVKYTYEEIKKTGICFDKNNLLKAEWKYFRKQMLWNVLVNDTLRIIAPQLLTGISALPKTKTNIQLHEQVPHGKHKGKNWQDLPDDFLKAALLCCRPEFTDGHRKAIRTVLKNRFTAVKA